MNSQGERDQADTCVDAVRFPLSKAYTDLGRNNLSAPVCIFLTAFFLRLFHILSQDTRDDFFSYFWLVDSSPYLYYASQLVKGESFLAWQSPLVSYVLATYFYLTDGGGHLGGKIVLALVGSVGCVLVYFFGLRVFGRWTAVLGAFLAAASFGSIMAAGAYNSEVLHGTLVLAVFLLCLRFAVKKSVGSAAWAGLFSGLCVFNRGEFVLMVPFVLSFLGFHSGPTWKRRISVLLVALFMGILALIPNSIRNYEFFHDVNRQLGKKVFPEFYLLAPYNQFIFARSSSPLNLVRSQRRIFGSNEGSEQTETRILIDPLHRKMFLEGRRMGWDFISANFKGFVKNAFLRTAVLGETFAFGFLETNSPSGLEGRNGRGDCFTPANRWLSVLQLPLFILGFWVSAKKNPVPHVLPLALFACTLTANAFFFGLTRYGIYLLPLIFLYEAAGLVFLLKMPGFNRKGSSGNPSGKIGANKAAIWVSAVLIMVGGAQAAGGIEVTPSRDFFLAAALALEEGKPEKARAEFESGFRQLEKVENVIRDDLILARFSFKLAGLQYQLGDPVKALEELKRTLNLDTFHRVALLNLGILSDRNGDKKTTVSAFRRLLSWYPNDPQYVVVKNRLDKLEGLPVAKEEGEEPVLIWPGSKKIWGFN